ncbi:ATPase [Lactiplantibacillus plantarum]|nr:ATPase [Lactiplantibacillus plantarum]
MYPELLKIIDGGLQSNPKKYEIILSNLQTILKTMVNTTLLKKYQNL